MNDDVLLIVIDMDQNVKLLKVTESYRLEMLVVTGKYY